MADEERRNLSEAVRALFEHQAELSNKVSKLLDGELISLSRDVLAQINKESGPPNIPKQPINLRRPNQAITSSSRVI